MYQTTQFKGIIQTSLLKYNSATLEDKKSYLWFVLNGDKKQIYLGDTLYGEVSDENLSIEEAIKGLIITDNVIKLTDKEGNAFGEGISIGDIFKGNIVHEVSYDKENKKLTITFNTEGGEAEKVEIDFSDLVDTPDKIVINKEITGLEEDKTLNEVLSDIYTKVGGNTTSIDDIKTNIETIEGNVTNIQTNLEDVKQQISDLNDAINSKEVSVEKSDVNTIKDGHIELTINNEGELYGVMYYMSDIVSGELTDKVMADFVSEDQPSVTISNATFDGSQSVRLNITKKDDVTLNDVTIKANNLANSGVINIKDSKEIDLNKLNINKDSNNRVYNGIEIGLNTAGETEAKVPNKIDIKNCDFGGEYTNNIINIFGTDNDTVVNIENCHFGKCSNVLRLSNRTDANNVVINMTNCSVDEWDTTSEYAGLFICQDYTSNNATEANLFGNGKVTINIKNLKLNGKVINQDYDGQLGYVFGDNTIIANELGDDRMPVVNFK